MKLIPGEMPELPIEIAGKELVYKLKKKKIKRRLKRKERIKHTVHAFIVPSLEGATFMLVYVYEKGRKHDLVDHPHHNVPIEMKYISPVIDAFEANGYTMAHDFDRPGFVLFKSPGASELSLRRSWEWLIRHVLEILSEREDGDSIEPAKS